ncbi:hypothetical protein D3H35_14000 [Cohnella faecalis]|uniref:Uncharacterized protein n=1 Tax=Cohnella faecalis TaxID=2315694 RepID=A0A398CKY6_9BACL|nr:hypothetical protein D3H35_14000 [Cohnella faecalis]
MCKESFWERFGRVILFQNVAKKAVKLVPDWSYRTLFRPLLFRLPARAARSLALGLFGAVGRMPGGAVVIKTLGHQEPSPLLETGWSATPVGLSGIVDPAGVARRGLARLGFGFMEIGPVTALPVESRQPIGLDAAAEQLWFPEPYENEGFNRVMAKLANPGHSLPQYVRVAPMPGLEPERTEPLTLLMMQELIFAGAAGFYVDALPPGWDLESSGRALSGVADWMEQREAELRRPLFLHVAPDIEGNGLSGFCKR